MLEAIRLVARLHDMAMMREPTDLLVLEGERAEVGHGRHEHRTVGLEADVPWLLISLLACPLVRAINGNDDPTEAEQMAEIGLGGGSFEAGFNGHRESLFFRSGRLVAPIVSNALHPAAPMERTNDVWKVAGWKVKLLYAVRSPRTGHMGAGTVCLPTYFVRISLSSPALSDSSAHDDKYHASGCSFA